MNRNEKARLKYSNSNNEVEKLIYGIMFEQDITMIEVADSIDISITSLKRYFADDFVMPKTMFLALILLYKPSFVGEDYEDYYYLKILGKSEKGETRREVKRNRDARKLADEFYHHKIDYDEFIKRCSAIFKTES